MVHKMVKPLNFETYLSLVRGSVGTKAYQALWANVDGSKKNVVKDGALSCAFFASFILTGFNFIEGIHATVPGVIRDLEKSGWQKTRKLSKGVVLVWEEKIQKSGPHMHIGFYIGGDKAISNHPDLGVPMEHHLTFGTRKGQPIRRVVAMYRRPEIEN